MKKEMKTKINNILETSARDLIALGSIMFILLVIARAWTGDYFQLITEVIIAVIIYLLLTIFIKKSEYHMAFGIILVFFLIRFYEFLPYNIFSSIVYLLMIISAIYLKKPIKNIFKGILLGLISLVISFYLSPFIINLLNIPI